MLKQTGAALRPGRKKGVSAKVFERDNDRIQEAVRILRHPIFLTSVAAVLLAGVLLGIFLRVSYARELNDGLARADTLSRLLEEQTVRSFQAVDLVLQGMSDAVRSLAIPNTIRPSGRY